MSDRKLLKKVRDGDKEALSDIVKQYYADIFRFCLYMIQNEEDSYDITQETFLKFMKYGTSYQRNNLKGLLNRLFQEVREVIILRAYEELKFKDIAKMMNCSLSTAKSRYRIGIQQMKNMIKEGDQ